MTFFGGRPGIPACRIRIRVECYAGPGGAGIPGFRAIAHWKCGLSRSENARHEPLLACKDGFIERIRRFHLHRVDVILGWFVPPNWRVFGQLARHSRLSSASSGQNTSIRCPISRDPRIGTLRLLGHHRLTSRVVIDGAVLPTYAVDWTARGKYTSEEHDTQLWWPHGFRCDAVYRQSNPGAAFCRDNHHYHYNERRHDHSVRRRYLRRSNGDIDRSASLFVHEDDDLRRRKR